MFDVENEEALITKISYIFSQFHDFMHFINVSIENKVFLLNFLDGKKNIELR